MIKAALAANATAEGNVVTFKVEDRDVKVTLNDQNLVDRVEYLFSNSVVGDVPVEITYSDYADFGGVQFPRHIVEKQDGFETLDVNITDVKPNAPVSLEVPANVASASPPPPVTATVEKVADGLWSINAAGTRSLAVEFADHIVMLEGPTSEARSLAANEAIAKTVPNKPIRYVVNTHAHYDHAGGLRTYVAQGITVITHESNKAFYEKGVGPAVDGRAGPAGQVTQGGHHRRRRGQEGDVRQNANARTVTSSTTADITRGSSLPICRRNAF